MCLQTEINDLVTHAPRRSVRGKAAVQTQPQVIVPRAPRKINYEIVRAPPKLIEEYNAARMEYHDAVNAWWWRQRNRAREDRPTQDDRAAVRLDPWVHATGAKLDALDEELTRIGVWVRGGTVANDSRAPAKVRAEARKCDAEYYAHAHAHQEGRTVAGHAKKRKRVASNQFATTSTSNDPAAHHTPLTSLTPITSPEPDPAPVTGENEFVFALSEHPIFAIKRQWLSSRNNA